MNSKPAESKLWSTVELSKTTGLMRLSLWGKVPYMINTFITWNELVSQPLSVLRMDLVINALFCLVFLGIDGGLFYLVAQGPWGRAAASALAIALLILILIGMYVRDIIKLARYISLSRQDAQKRKATQS